jgi:hypothetical protein
VYGRTDITVAKAVNLGAAHLGGMPLAVEEDESTDPVDAVLLGPRL